MSLKFLPHFAVFCDLLLNRRTATWNLFVLYDNEKPFLFQNNGQTMIFLRDSLCLSAVTLSRQRHDILDFSNCPLSRVLHVTLANWQRFGFEFHLRSSPS